MSNETCNVGRGHKMHNTEEKKQNATAAQQASVSRGGHRAVEGSASRRITSNETEISHGRVSWQTR